MDICMTANELKLYKKVQDADRYTLNVIIEYIRPDVSEVDLVRKCDELQRSMGINSC